MIVRGATSVLLALAICTAENNVHRWSKPDQDLKQGEWVPLNSDRFTEGSARIQSAINPPHQINHALLRNPPPHHFEDDFQQKQVFGSHSTPPRIALLHPQSINPQTVLQPQIPSQQLLSQFLNQQIEQSSLPIFSRALLQGQPGLNPNYYQQQESYNLKPAYNQISEFQNGQYNLDTSGQIGGRYNDKEENRGSTVRGNQIPKKIQQSVYGDDTFDKNLSLPSTQEKEEVQILYVPVEMLKQQEQAKNAAKSVPAQDERHSFAHIQPNPNAQMEINQKESKKFRHPIQPLKDQVPAYHLRDMPTLGKLVPSFPTSGSDEGKGAVKYTEKAPHYTDQRSPLPSRNEYIRKYNSNDSGRGQYSNAPTNKEQLGDESTIQDEVSAFRNAGPTRRTPQKDIISRQTTTLPPPNQPPLSVFMETTSNNRVGDVLGLLKDSKTIPVLDSIGSDAPQVFVGPSNLNTPPGYLKYELPYLSSLNSNNAGQKLLQVPFFVAPLNFQPPPGFAKIPFPPPHIGSVVLSNLTSYRPNENGNIPTPPSLEEHTANYKESFTIPADISSISPQLPSLINSLQEEEFAGHSSTESLAEPTEEPAQKYRRPTNSRRQNNRGSQRGYATAATTTRRPSSRQRKPPTRYYNQRNNQQSELNEPAPVMNIEQEYNSGNGFTYKANKRPELQQTENSHESVINKSPDSNTEQQQSSGAHFTGALGNEKQEQRTFDQNKDNYFALNAALSTYPTDQTIHPNDGRSEMVYQQGRIENVEQPITQLFHDVRPSGGNQYHKDSLNNPLSSDNRKPNLNEYHLPSQHALMKPLSEYEHSNYHSDNRTQLSNLDETSGKLNGFEEVDYRKNLRGESQNSPDSQSQNHNYRSQNKFAGAPSGISADSGFEKPLTQQDIAPNDERAHHRTTNQEVHNQFQGSYGENSDIQNTSPSGFSGDLNNYREPVNQVKLTDAEYQTKFQEHDTQHTALKNGDFNDQINNYESGHISQTPRTATERTSTVRSRSRFRGRPYNNQVQQTQPATSTQSFHYREEPEKVNPISRHRPSNALQSSENEDLGISYTVPSENYPSQYSTTDQTTTSPSRKFAHVRGRRPLRPTTSMTTTTTTTSTIAPPGKKYLIRTRKPTVAHTRLQSGRGRIRKPTTPTTTTTSTTTEPTPAPDYPKQLPFQWRQPAAQQEYNIKEDVDTPISDAPQYQRPREQVSYQDGRSGDIQLQNQQTVRFYPQTRTEPARRVPNYSYEPEEEIIPVQKQYQTTEGSHYSTTYEKVMRPHYTQDYETTQKPHLQREYETTQKPHYIREHKPQKTHYSREYDTTPKPQYSQEYETTPNAQYSREYETTPKPHYSREYESSQKPHYSREYEPSQKPHYTREYEASQKPHYSREYENTRKPHYSREYENTRKPHYSRDQEPAQKPQYSREYEPTEKPYNYKNYEDIEKAQNSKELEQVQNSPQYDEYDVTNKPSHINEFATTQKPQTTRDTEPTRRAQTFQEYETTQNPYIQHDETPQKPYSPTTSVRNSGHNHRRRPVSASRGGESKSQQTESPISKDSNSDFWNQAVTIQQSQSYVYTPDGNLAPSEGQSSNSDQAKPNLQTDYDDYYNYQEGGQYTSDQSPFPSNDQHITYTKVKPSQEVGKANQYAEKEFDKPLPEEVPIVTDSSVNNSEIEQNKQEQSDKSNYSTSDEYDRQPVQEDYKEQPAFPVEDELSGRNKPQVPEPASQIKTGRRRGTWVRVRVKKPKDVFETAESQRFSSVRENALVPGLDQPKLSGDKSGAQKSTPNGTDYIKLEAEDATAPREEGLSESNTQSPETSTNGESLQTADSIYTTDPGTETETQNELDQNLTTESSLLKEETTLQSNPETFRTSTTTEISLETEICYKGKCIKTKRKKDESGKGLELLK